MSKKLTPVIRYYWTEVYMYLNDAAPFTMILQRDKNGKPVAASTVMTGDYSNVHHHLTRKFLEENPDFWDPCPGLHGWGGTTTLSPQDKILRNKIAEYIEAETTHAAQTEYIKAGGSLSEQERNIYTWLLELAEQIRAGEDKKW